MPMSNRNKRMMNWAVQHATDNGWVSPFVMGDYLLLYERLDITPKRAVQMAGWTLRKWAGRFNLFKMNGEAGVGELGLWIRRTKCPNCGSDRTEQTELVGNYLERRKCQTCELPYEHYIQ